MFQAIDASRTALVTRYRAIFNKGMSSTNEKLRKAAAWYSASFEPNATFEPNAIFSKPCLSFGWIMADKLAALKTRLREPGPRPSPTMFAQDLADSVLEHFNSVTGPRLSQLCSCLMPCAKHLAKLIKDQAVKVKATVEVNLTGSLSVFLNSESSDLNIAVSQICHPAPVSVSLYPWSP